jgi:hypothetical protein
VAREFIRVHLDELLLRAEPVVWQALLVRLAEVSHMPNKMLTASKYRRLNIGDDRHCIERH